MQGSYLYYDPFDPYYLAQSEPGNTLEVDDDSDRFELNLNLNGKNNDIKTFKPSNSKSMTVYWQNIKNLSMITILLGSFSIIICGVGGLIWYINFTRQESDSDSLSNFNSNHVSDSQKYIDGISLLQLYKNTKNTKKIKDPCCNNKDKDDESDDNGKFEKKKKKSQVEETTKKKKQSNPKEPQDQHNFLADSESESSSKLKSAREKHKVKSKVRDIDNNQGHSRTIKSKDGTITMTTDQSDSTSRNLRGSQGVSDDVSKTDLKSEITQTFSEVKYDREKQCTCPCLFNVLNIFTQCGNTKSGKKYSPNNVVEGICLAFLILLFAFFLWYFACSELVVIPCCNGQWHVCAPIVCISVIAFHCMFKTLDRMKTNNPESLSCLSPNGIEIAGNILIFVSFILAFVYLIQYIWRTPTAADLNFDGNFCSNIFCLIMAILALFSLIIQAGHGPMVESEINGHKIESQGFEEATRFACCLGGCTAVFR